MAPKSKWEILRDYVTQRHVLDPDAEPDLWIQLLQVPTVARYSGLRRQLKTSSEAWMVQFLDLRGLDLLMEALKSLLGRGCAQTSNAILQLICVYCIRAVMNSSEGLKFILDNEGYVRTLTQALDTSSMMVKMQVFELLAALADYNHQGYQQTLDAFHKYKKQQYRFSVIMNELHGTSSVAYMVVLMSMVNVLVLGQEDLRRRVRMRQEFIGLQLLPLLPRLRETVDVDLNVQCDLFENSMTKDEEEMERLYGGMDMSSHQEVFTLVFTKVSSSPSSVQLLSILQALLLVDPSRADIWSTLEKLTSRAGLVAQDPDSDSVVSLLDRLLPQKSLSANHKVQTIDRVAQTRLPRHPPDQSEAMINNILTPANATKPEKAPSPPPPPPPPPGIGPPPPPLPGTHTNHIRRPTVRMKKLNWQKLPSRVVTDHQSLWTWVSSDSVEPDYCSIEQLFSLPQTEPKTRTKTKTEPKEISFINAKKSLNLNIFLKQFKCSHEDFVSLIHEGDRSKFDVETLKQLIKLLPEKHEVENLKSHQADRDKMASVDQFYLQLLDVPSYELRTECMLLCEESSCEVETLQRNAELLDRACQSVKESTRLPTFCKLILRIGNFLNYGTHTGNAEAFHISTLLKLTETKANKSRMTLLHHILEEVEENHPDLLKLPDDLQMCVEAAGVNAESVQSEVKSLTERLKNSEKKLSSSSEDVKEQYLSAIQESLRACEQLQQVMSSVEEKRRDLAEYLCEDGSSFSLDDLFTTIKTFRDLFLRAVKENESRRAHEKRRKKQEEERKLKRDKTVTDTVDGGNLDKRVAEILRGVIQRKTRTLTETDRMVQGRPAFMQASLGWDEVDSPAFNQSQKISETKMSTGPPSQRRPGSGSNRTPSEAQNPSKPSTAVHTDVDQSQTRVQDSGMDSGPGTRGSEGQQEVQISSDDPKENENLPSLTGPETRTSAEDRGAEDDDVRGCSWFWFWSRFRSRFTRLEGRKHSGRKKRETS